MEEKQGKKRRIFEITKAKIPLSIIPVHPSISYRSILSLTKQKFHPWCITILVNVSIDLFSSTRQKCIHHRLSSIFLSCPDRSYIFLSSKRKNFSITKTQSMRQFLVSIPIIQIYLSLFFFINETMYIPNSRWWLLHAANRGWITLGCDRNRFQGNWYRLRAINNVHASTNRGGIEDIRPGVGQFLDRDYTHVGTICEQHRGRILRDAWAWTVLVFGLVSRSCSISNIVNFLHEHFVELMFLFIGSWSLWGLVECTAIHGKKVEFKVWSFLLLLLSQIERVCFDQCWANLGESYRVFNYFYKSILFESYDVSKLNSSGKISTTLENKELIFTIYRLAHRSFL